MSWVDQRYLRYPRHSGQGQLDVLDGKRLRHAKDQRAIEMSAGSLIFVAAEDNIIFVEAGQVKRQRRHRK